MSTQCSRLHNKKEASILNAPCHNGREQKEIVSFPSPDDAGDISHSKHGFTSWESFSWLGQLKQRFTERKAEAAEASKEEVGFSCDSGDASSYPCSGASGDSRPTETSNSMEILSNVPECTTHTWLSTDREKSSIPMYGTHQTWAYPSSLQFYKAMERRDKNPDASAMDAVVYVHNHVNEETWRAILKWEEMHSRKCTASRSLIRFTGRYADLSWKAWWKSRFSTLGRPFDRHDWTIDRCGKPVRYIIDYYDDTQKDDDFQVTIDARPAPDSVQNIYDRIRYAGWRYFKQSSAAGPHNA